MYLWHSNRNAYASQHHMLNSIWSREKQPSAFSMPFISNTCHRKPTCLHEPSSGPKATIIFFAHTHTNGVVSLYMSSIPIRSTSYQKSSAVSHIWIDIPQMTNIYWCGLVCTRSWVSVNDRHVCEFLYVQIWYIWPYGPGRGHCNAWAMPIS